MKAESNKGEFWKSSNNSEPGMGQESRAIFIAMLPAWKNKTAYIPLNFTWACGKSFKGETNK